MTIDNVRTLALTLPRSYEALVRDRVEFRVGRIVYLAFSRDDHGDECEARRCRGDESAGDHWSAF